jgi:hypothetical protein
MKVTVCAELVGNVDVVDLSGFAEDTYAIAAAMRMPTFNTPASSQPCVPPVCAIEARNSSLLPCRMI